MRHDGFDPALLLDYYGELLPEKQRTYCDLSFNQDYSLTEIAEFCGISRQGVHDALSHAEASLRSFERVLGCAERDAMLREQLAAAAAALAPLLTHEDPEVHACAERAQAALKTVLE